VIRTAAQPYRIHCHQYRYLFCLE